jgi:hypothetical protein
LHCVQNNYENFVCIGSCNEIFWYNKCTHIPIMGQIAQSPYASPLHTNFVMFFLFVSQLVVDESIMLCTDSN